MGLSLHLSWAELANGPWVCPWLGGAGEASESSPCSREVAGRVGELGCAQEHSLCVTCEQRLDEESDV